MSILREIFVRVGLQKDEASFAAANLEVEAIKKVLGELADAAKWAAEKIKEVGEVVLANVQKTAEYAEQVKKLSLETGIGTDALQRLGKAAATQGVGLEELSHGLLLMSVQANKAKEGAKEAQAAFKAVGVTVQQLRTEKPEDLFFRIAESIQTVKDGVSKGALLKGVLGRSGAGLVDVLDPELLAQYAKSKVLTKEQLDAGKDLVVVQRQLESITASIWKEAIAPLLPAIDRLLRKYRDWRKENAELLKLNIAKFTDAMIKGIDLVGVAFDKFTAAVKVFRNNWELTKLALLTISPILIGIGAAVVSVASIIGAGLAVALAPLAAFLYAIRAVYLIYDDIRTFEDRLARGKTKGAYEHTLFGKFQTAIKKWDQKGNKPWFLSWIEEAAADLKAIVDDVKFLNGEANNSPLAQKWRHLTHPVESVANYGKSVARQITPYAKAFGTVSSVLARHVITEPAEDLSDRFVPRLEGVTAGIAEFVRRHSPTQVPSYTPAGTPFRGGDINIELNVHAAPGHNEERLAHHAGRAVAEALSEHGVVDRSTLEATKAAHQ